MNDPLKLIQERRAEQAALHKRNTEHQESTGAVKDSSELIRHEIARQGAKSRTTPIKLENDNLAKSDDVQSVVDSVNRLNITTFMASKDNWTTVVEEMAGAAERIQSVVDGLSTGGIDKIEKSFSQAVDSLQAIVAQIKTVKVQNDEDVKRELRALAVAFDAKEMQPIVNVPAPVVKVQGKEIDLSPLTNLLSEIKASLEMPEKVNLDDYRAQDIANDGESFQYVGFVNLTGGWYIIQNDVENNSLRYKFGSRGYAKAWDSYVGHSYKLLNEAIHEV